MTSTKGVTVWLALWKVARDIDKIALGDIATTGVCTSDFAVLETLMNVGPSRVNAIAERVMLTSGSMTTAVDRLEERGLVRRAPDPTDARARVVELTESGRELIEPAFRAHQETMDGVFAGLSGEERASLLKLLLKLRTSLKRPA